MTEANTIQFFSDRPKMVMKITSTGIWVDPDIQVDEAAQAVLAALDEHIKMLVERAVAAEREACAKVLDEMAARDRLSNYYAVASKAIRARGQT